VDRIVVVGAGLAGLTAARTLRQQGFAGELTLVGDEQSRNVVIIGAGFIGCEVAATLTQTVGARITVVDVAQAPMPVIGAEAGARARDPHERQPQPRSPRVLAAAAARDRGRLNPHAPGRRSRIADCGWHRPLPSQTMVPWR
jgi:glycine/D-amino acid oxidase-like deaminating enzyme